MDQKMASPQRESTVCVQLRARDWQGAGETLQQQMGQSKAPKHDAESNKNSTSDASLHWQAAVFRTAKHHDCNP